MPDLGTIETANGSHLAISPVWLTNGKSPELCPITSKPGHQVKQVTLGNHLRPEHWCWVKKEGFHFCPDPHCEVVYYNNFCKVYFTQQDIRVRVGIKRGSSPTPVCYCTNVTAEDIFEEIQVKQCCDSLEDIKQFTKARTGVLCHITNPSGKCCGGHVMAVVEKALASKETKRLEPYVHEICRQISKE